MKIFAFLLSVLLLLACSDSENVAYLNDSDLIAEEGSSSSADALSSATSSVSGNAPFSSSSDVAVQSSGNEQQTSSSSYYLDFLDVGAPGSGGGCAVAFSAVAGSDASGGFRPSDSTIFYEKSVYPYRLIIEGRTSKLVSESVPAEEAGKTAKREFVTVLGLDTLFSEVSFTRADVEDALNLIFSYDSVTLYSVVQLFSEKGTLDRSEYCGIWNATWNLGRGWGRDYEEKYYAPYEKLSVWVRSLASRGCFHSGNEDVAPTLIIGNVYRKCIGLPYCSADMFGSVKRAGLKNIISDTLYFCNARGWNLLVNYEEDTKDIPCDEIGKMFKSTSLNERYYVCKENGWNVTTKMDYETKDIPCGDSAKIVQSPTDSTRFYLCKDSKWKIATQLEKETTGVPCDRVGKMLESEIKSNGGVIYICRDSGWDVATYREKDIGDRACDAEGKTVQGLRDTSMSYVCYNNAWTDFYKAPCSTDNQRRKDSNRGDNEQYICYNGKWHSSIEWNCDFPKEYYFNPNIEYGTLTDNRDGETYRTVEFRGKIWMAENLRYAIGDSSQSYSAQEGCQIAGRFYSIEAAATACPAGWRLPDTTELNLFYSDDYNHLSMYEKNSYLAKFKSQIGSRCSAFSCNESGLSFLMLGLYPKAENKNYENVLYWIYGDDSTKDIIFLYLGDTYMYFNQAYMDFYLPIRCVKE